MERRQSIEQPEIKETAEELNENLCDDKMDVVSISSDDSQCSTELDFLGIPPSHTSEASSEQEEYDEIEEFVGEDTDTDTDMSVELTGAWSSQEMCKEQSEQSQSQEGDVGNDDEEIEELVQDDEQEEERGDHDNNEEDEQNGAERQQKILRRARKQGKPKKLKDRVTKDIIKSQSATNLMISRLPFKRVVHEVLQQFKIDYRLQSEALECIRESSEAYLVQLFEDANLACFKRSSVTLDVEDMRLVEVLRGLNDP